MKKLLFFMFISTILTFIFIPKLNATTNMNDLERYIEVNVGNEEMLEEEGLTLISGSVDFKKEGNYTLTYSTSSGDTVKSIVHIISKNDSYLIKSGKENEINIPKDNYIIDIKNINEHDFYVICRFSLEDSLPDEEKISIIYYENNKQVWEYHFHRYARYISSILYNDNLIVTGEIYNENDNYKTSICLFEITKTREIIKNKEIKTDTSCSIKGFHLYDNYLFLVTTTAGTTLDYEGINMDNTNRLIVLKVNYEYFKIQSFYNFESLDNFVAHDTAFYKDRITCHVSFKDKVIIDNISYTDAIYEISANMDKEKVSYFDLQYYTYNSYIVTQSTIYYIGKKNINDDYLIVQNISGEVYYKQIYLDQYDKYPITNASLVRVNGDTFYLSLSYEKANTSHFLGYCKLNKAGDPVYYNNLIINEKPFKNNIYDNKLYKTYYSLNKIYTKKVDLLEKLTEEVNNEYYKIKRNMVIVNGENLKNINDSKYDLQFGKYKRLAKFIDTNNTKYYLEDEINVEAKANVLNNEVYQSGIKINSNGEMILNGSQINNGYTVDRVGKYLLVIKGINCPDTVINFEVKDLVMKNVTNEKMEVNILKERVIPTVSKNISSNEVELQLNELSRSNDILYFSIAIFLVSILGFVLLRKKI